MASSKRWKNYKQIGIKTKKTYPFILGLAVGAGLTELLENVYLEVKSRLLNQTKSSSLSTTQIIEENYGLPKAIQNLHYSYYALGYDNAKKVPSWVAEYLTKAQLQGPAERYNCNFKHDLKIPAKFRSSNEDYLGSGFARGHMVPAGDIKSDQGGMSETFYLSNIVPQDYGNNGGFWYRMEVYCRTLAKRYDGVYVISGPLFKPEKDDSGKKFLKFQVIGENNVAVPTHLYKVILIEKNHKPKAIGSFIVPNATISDQKTLQDFQVSLEEIEKLTGYEIFPKLDNNRVKDLCAVDDCKLIKKELLDLYNMTRWLQKAKSNQELDKIWKVIKNKGIQVDQQFLDEYWKKKNQFKQDEGNG
ncbi:nuclease EXOG, mitochondrial-like [Hydractinia symbiolongicarpus]|uniref:nuclease EXOG, mitochondrial-like n=1 Tax=Hydractinia symbiolongicarpus TaxID=13093 RepID=UPI002550C9A6|nr:nuclease EXOG, mitochondrial-like [Hydractinia symbiolongicarpus]